MKFLILFLILNTLFSFKVQAQSSNCSGADRNIAQSADWVKKSFKDRDVSIEVEYIESIVEKCNVNISKFGWGRGIFDYWKNTGYEAELDKTKDQIEHYSKYRDVSPELEKFKKYSVKLKRNTTQVNSYYAQYLNQGKKAGSIEEKKCQPNVDLRNETLGQVRDQDSVGWCYAFASADLLTYKLGKRVSALDIALSNNNSWINNLFLKMGSGEQDLEGGWAPTAIENVKSAGGVCLEESIKSEDNGYGSLFTSLAEIHNFKKSSIRDRSAQCPQAVRSLFPNIDDRTFLEIAEKSSQDTIIKMLQSNSCKKRIKIDSFKVQSTTSYFEGGRNELFDVMNEQLANKKNIVAISYNPRVLYDTNYSGSLGGHASSVVGRRFNKTNGECEYLIRNSWGRGCSGYDEKLECQDGNIWVPKSVLVKGIRNVNYIE